MMRILPRSNFARAFTLIELLVVLGLVSVLIALLLPVISSARQRADQVKCSTTLRSIGLAAQFHANDHDGFLPAAGWHWAPAGGVVNPHGLGDDQARRYVYYDDNGEKRPVPITAALARSTGVAIRLGSRAELEADLHDEAVTRLFRCPSQATLGAGLTQKEDGYGWVAPRDWSSYVFNEAILGRREQRPWRTDPVMGHLTRIKHSSTVMFAMDGRPREPVGDDWLMVPDEDNQDTLWEFKLMLDRPDDGHGKQLLDLFRHRGKANVLFVDGHVDAVPLTQAGMSTVGISKGVYD